MLPLYAQGFPVQAIDGRTEGSRPQRIQLQRTEPQAADISPKILHRGDIIFKPLENHAFFDYAEPLKHDEDTPGRTIPADEPDNDGSIAQRILLRNCDDVKYVGKIFIFSDEPYVIPVYTKNTVESLGIKPFLKFRLMPVGCPVWGRDKSPHPPRFLRSFSPEVADSPFAAWVSVEREILLGRDHLAALPPLSLLYPEADISKPLISSDVITIDWKNSSLISNSIISFIPLTLDMQQFKTLPEQIKPSVQVQEAVDIVESSFHSTMRLFGISDITDIDQMREILEISEQQLDEDASFNRYISKHIAIMRSIVLFPFKHFGDLHFKNVAYSVNSSSSISRRDNTPRYIPSFESKKKKAKLNARNICSRVLPKLKYVKTTDSFKFLSGIAPPAITTSAREDVSVPYCAPTHFFAFVNLSRSKHKSSKDNLQCSDQPPEAADEHCESSTHSDNENNVKPQSAKEQLIDAGIEVSANEKIKPTIKTSALTSAMPSYIEDDSFHHHYGELNKNIVLNFDTQSRVQMFITAHSRNAECEETSLDRPDDVATGQIEAAAQCIVPMIAPGHIVTHKEVGLVEMKSTTPLDLDDKSIVNGLKLLISEDMLNKHQRLVLELEGTYGIEAIDSPIAYPMHILTDDSTAVSLVNGSIFDDKQDFRNWLLHLTKSAFKFACIYIIIVEDSQFCNRANATFKLRHATLQFPCIVCLRHCMNDQLGFTIFSISAECAISAAVREEELLSEYIKSTCVLQRISADRFAYARSELLQMMPTINLNLAILLLSRWSIKDLVSLSDRTEDIDFICRGIGRISSFFIRSRIGLFLQLTHCYWGLDRVTVSSPAADMA